LIAKFRRGASRFCRRRRADPGFSSKNCKINALSHVIAGLVPAIQKRRSIPGFPGNVSTALDARNKSGHDKGKAGAGKFPALVVAVDAFVAFVAFLGFKGQGRDGTRIKAAKTDGFARFFAIAIFSGVDLPERCFNFCDQFPLPVPGAQFQGFFRFAGCAVGDIGKLIVIFLETAQRALAFADDFLFLV
jgi:hypothetical protein